MTISSAARSIAVATPARDVAFSERATFSRKLFCLHYGPECGSTGRTAVAYTNKLRTVVASVNRSVNRALPQIRAQREFLSLSPLPGRGDDYAMMKRSALIRAGLPAGALRIATVKTEAGRTHAVLVLSTSSGDLVLDHRQPSVMKRRDSGYVFASLEAIRFFD